jgi:hypothetical protein
MNSKRKKLPYDRIKLLRQLLAGPFLIIMIVPVVVLDAFLLMYSYTAMPLCRIPRVSRKDYIIYDRELISQLSLPMKVFCYYCSYVNGLFAYAVEIAGRTERYWCPLKTARKDPHRWQESFASAHDNDWNTKFFDEQSFE